MFERSRATRGYSDWPSVNKLAENVGIQQVSHQFGGLEQTVTIKSRGFGGGVTPASRQQLTTINQRSNF